MQSTARLLEGVSAIVTGAASGIGAAVVARLQEEGARVAGLDLQPAAAADVACELDLRSPADLAAALATAEAALGPARVLVHCAGICPPGTLLDDDDAVWRDTYEVNVLSAVRLLRHCAPKMHAQGGGSVVLTSSINARFATPMLAAYAASKAALESLVRSAALELAPWQVRVNAIAPASIDTPMLRASFERDADPAAARARNVERHPLGRLGSARDIAEMAVFLAGGRSGWVTGGIFPVDGGAGVTRR